jgi:hypothetical protein
MPSDFCATCLRDYDAMTVEERARHYCLAEYVVRTCDGKWDLPGLFEEVGTACENLGSDMDVTDDYSTSYRHVRECARALVAAAKDDRTAIFNYSHPTYGDIVEFTDGLVDTLDSEDIDSDDRDADLVVVNDLLRIIDPTFPTLEEIAKGKT